NDIESRRSRWSEPLVAVNDRRVEHATFRLKVAHKPTMTKRHNDPWPFQRGPYRFDSSPRSLLTNPTMAIFGKARIFFGCFIRRRDFRVTGHPESTPATTRAGFS